MFNLPIFLCIIGFVNVEMLHATSGYIGITKDPDPATGQSKSFVVLWWVNSFHSSVQW